MKQNKQFTAKWLWGLFWLHMVGTLLSALALAATAVPFAVGDWYRLAQTAVSIATMVALFLLSGRYRFAGIAKAGVIILEFLPVLLHYWLLPRMSGVDSIHAINQWTTALSRIGILLGWVAVFLEYTAHGALVPTERNKWNIFLICSIAVSLVSSIAIRLLQPMLESLDTGFLRLWNLGARGLNLVLSIVYLVLLYRIIQTQAKE